MLSTQDRARFAGMCRAEDALNALDEVGLALVLEHYALGVLRTAWQVEQGFVNDNYVLETTRGRFFLKRRHPSLRRGSVIRAQHALIGRIRGRGFPAPRLVPTEDGETLLVLEEQYYEIQEFIEGTPYDHGRPAHLEEAGTVLGRYHRAVEGFNPPALSRGGLYSPEKLHTNLEDLTEAWRLGHDPGLAPVLDRLAVHAEDLAAGSGSHGPLPSLVIHGDYYAGNLLFDGDRIVGVVDYDKARYLPRVVELAEALIYFASPRPGHLQGLVYPGFLEWEPFARFLQAYASVVVPEEDEVTVLPDLIRCIWLQISLQRLLEKGGRPPEAGTLLHGVLALGDWARENAARMVETARSANKELP